MPKFPSQIPRTIPPKFHTASDQRSLRDADALPRQHIRHTTTNFQQSGNTNQIAELTRQIMRMRLRKQIEPEDIVAGKVRGEFDLDAIYTVQDIIVISLGANQGTFCYISEVPSTGSSGDNPTLPPYAGAGQWMQLPGGLLGQWF